MNKRIATIAVFIGVFALSGCGESLYDCAASEELASSSKKAHKIEEIKSIWCYYTAGQRGIGPLVNYKIRRPMVVIDDNQKINTFMDALWTFGKTPVGTHIIQPGGVAMVIFFKSGGKPAYFHCYLRSDGVLATPLLDPDVATLPDFPFYQYLLKNYPQLTGSE